MSVIIVATLIAQNDHVDAVRAALKNAVAAVHSEPGCELYALHEGAGDRFVTVEQWADESAVRAHEQGSALRSLRAEIAGKLVKRPHVVLLEALPSGTTQQGILRDPAAGG